MAGERLVLNPTLDDSGNSPLELSGQDGSIGNGLLLMDHSYPMPPTVPQWVSSADSEGESLANTRYGNRTIGVTLRVAEPQDAASTNLATNPKCAVDTTGWTNSGMASIARAVLYGSEPDGLAGVGSDTALKTVGNSDLDLCYLQAPVTNTKTYTFSAWVYLSANSATGVRLLVNKGGGSDAASSATFSTLNAWTRLSVSFTADATATWWFAIEQIGAGATTAYTTGVLIEQASLGNYFDGDSPGCAWTGTHHASTSTRPAPGGNRLLKITDDLQEAVDRLNREGGVLMRVSPGGEPIFFDCSEAQVEFDNDNALLFARRTTAKLSFTAKPFWRGVWTTLTDHVETALPVAKGTDVISGGQVPSLGRLVIDEDQGVDHWWAVWGIRSRNYSSAASAALFWEAEALTVLSDTTAVAGATGASGGGSNVLRQTNLSSSYVAMLSTQATGGGAHMSHVGTYRVFARLYRPTSNTGAVSVAWEWAEGDFRKRTTNASVNYAVDEREAAFTLADLGYVSLTKVAAGTQRWEGRLLAKSTVAGDEIDCDCMFFIPVDEGAGQVSAVFSTQNPSIWSARTTFDTEAGAITGDSLAVGGTWAAVANSDLDDFNVASGVATRTSTSDTGTIGGLTNSGRMIVATPTLDVTAATVDFKRSADTNGGIGHALILRQSGTSFAIARVLTGGDPANGDQLVLQVVVGGSTDAQTVASLGRNALSVGTYYRLRAVIGKDGSFVAYLGQGDAISWTASLYDDALATGLPLASGKTGIYDANGSAVACTRTYDNFGAWVPVLDAAAFASQSLAIYPDRVIREDPGGTLWSPVSKYEGAFARLPATGREDRTLETIVKLSRNDPMSGADSGIDDLSFQWQHAPRGLTLPEPT